MLEAIAEIITAIAAIGAFCASVYAVIISKRIKSYEHMIMHRMEIYSALQKRFTELWRLTSPEYMDRHRKNMKRLGYTELLHEPLGEIEILLSRSEKQEFLLLGDCEGLKRRALEYWKDPAPQVKRRLLRKREIVFDFADIYLWSLWQYLQQLYKNPKKKLHGLFNEEFDKTYKAARKIQIEHGCLSQFFRKYDIVEKLLDMDKEKKK